MSRALFRFLLRLPVVGAFALLAGGCASSQSNTLGTNDASHNFHREPDDTDDSQASLNGVQLPYGPESTAPGDVNHD